MSEEGKVETDLGDHPGSARPIIVESASAGAIDLDTELRFPGSEEVTRLLESFDERLSAAEAQIGRVLARLSAS